MYTELFKELSNIVQNRLEFIENIPDDYADLRERLEAWSALSIAVNDLRTRPVPTLTLKQLAQRPALLEEAQKVLDTTADTNTLQDMAKKIKKFK